MSEALKNNQSLSFVFAYSIGKEEMKKKSVKAFRKFVEDFCRESGHIAISEDADSYVKVFESLINSDI